SGTAHLKGGAHGVTARFAPDDVCTCRARCGAADGVKSPPITQEEYNAVAAHKGHTIRATILDPIGRKRESRCSKGVSLISNDPRKHERRVLLPIGTVVEHQAV